jgi:hypothetical protein
MAIIDRTKENVRLNVSSPVPIGSSEFAGARGRALEKVGDQLIGIGVNMYKAEASSKASQASVELENFYKQARDQAIQTSSADGSDIEQKYNDIVADGAQKIKEKYSGNVLANTQIENYDNQARTGELSNLQTLKLKKAEAYHSNVIEQVQAAEVNKIYNAKNNFEMKAYLSSAIVSNNRLIDEQVQNGVISPTKALELKEGFRGSLADNLLDGMVQRKDFGQALAYVGGVQEDTSLYTEISPDEAKRLGFVTSQEAAQLSGKGESFKVAAMTKKDKMKSKMTPEEAYVMSALPQGKREALRRKLEDKMQVEAHLKLSDLNARLNAMEKLSFSARNLPDSFYDKAINEVNRNPLLSPEARSRLGGQIAIMKSVNLNMSRITEVPIGKQGQLITDAETTAKQMLQGLAGINPQFKDFDKDITIQAYQLEARDKMQKSILSFNEDVKADSKAMILATSKDLQTLEKASADAGRTNEGAAAFRQYNEAILAKQKALGYPQKLLTSAEAMEFGAYLKTSLNSADSYTQLASAKQKFGEHFPRVIDELIKSDPSLKDYAAIAHVDNYMSKPIIDAIKNAPAISKEFSAGGTFAGQDKLIKRRVEQSNSPIRKMFIDPKTNDSTNLATMQGLEAAITTVAKQDMVMNKVSAKEAADNAFKKVVGDNFHIVDRARSSFLVPKTLPDGRKMPDTNLVEAFVEVYSNPANMKDLNISRGKNETDMTPEGEMAYYQAIAPRMKWANNPSSTGLNLLYFNNEGKWINVGDKQGRPIERLFSDMYLNPTDKVRNGGVDLKARQKFLQDIKMPRGAK